ncbi:MAG: cytochrome c peroxidase [Myxococcota bacterium]
MSWDSRITVLQQVLPTHYHGSYDFNSMKVLTVKTIRPENMQNGLNADPLACGSCGDPSSSCPDTAGFGGEQYHWLINPHTDDILRDEYRFTASTHPLMAQLEVLSLRALETPHMAPDHDYEVNPYYSTAQGMAVNGTSNFKTYRVLLYASDVACPQPPVYPGCDSENPTRERIGFVKGHIVVEDPDGSSPEVIRAQLDSDFVTLYSGNSPITGIEPTLTEDGRLLIFHEREPAALVYYSFNPQSGENTVDATGTRSNGWEPPRPLRDIHNRVGDLVPQPDPSLPRRRFEHIYPVARFPMRFPDGGVFDVRTGAYPWVDLDGEDVFFTTTEARGNLRGGTSVIGASTGGMLRHIDGGINKDRDYTRRFVVSSFGTIPGPWAPPDLDESLPHSRKKRTYGLIHQKTAEYFETSAEEFIAGDYDVVLPMNPAIKGPTVLFNTGNPNENRRALQYHVGPGTDPGGNPYLGMAQDISGKYHAAYLVSGVQFSSEYFGCVTGSPCPALYNEDRFSGSAAYFEPGGRIRIPNRSLYPSGADARSLLEDGNSLTVSFAIRLGTGGEETFIVNKPFVFDIRLEADRELAFGVFTDGVRRLTSDLCSPLVLNTWEHVALTYDAETGEIQCFRDGLPSGSPRTIVSGPIGTSTNPVVLGPTTAQTTRLALDQFALSAKVRTDDEIARQALGLRPSFTAVDNGLPVGLLRRDQAHANRTALNADLMALGEILFFDAQLSRNAQVSCSSCHDPAQHFADPGQATSAGIPGKAPTRNTPSLLNLAFYEDFFLDGSGDEMQERLVDVIEDEMEGSLADIVSYVNSAPPYGSARNGLGGSVTEQIVLDALAEFIFGLFAANSTHDQVIAHVTTFTPQQRQGFELFNGKARCAQCHHGSNFTDNMYHNTGLVSSGDEGRQSITGHGADAFRFRTPSLRNVRETAPYFHDGSATNLQEVVQLYNLATVVRPPADPLIQPLGLSADERNALVAYLWTLSTPESQLPTANQPSGVYRGLLPDGTVDAPEANASCTLDGVTVPHGSSHTFYGVRESAYCFYYRITRTCNNGELSGNSTYRYAECSAPCNQPTGALVDGVCESVPSATRGLLQDQWTYFFAETPDNAGYSYWFEVLQDSPTVSTCKSVIRSFHDNSTFQNRNLSDSQYLDTLYQAVLNRAADSGGKNFYLSLLSGGTSRSSVFNTFLNGTEATSRCSAAVSPL